MKSLVRGFLAGAALGSLIAAAITFSRWLTWKPYAPVHLPYDLALCALPAGILSAALHLFLRRTPGGEGGGRAGRAGRWSAPAFLLAAVALLFCALAPPPNPLPELPASRGSAAGRGRTDSTGGLAQGSCRSVVLIVLDTLRRSEMSLYGYARRTTPNLDRWASGALVFDDATSVASWTLPAHASMFTGLYPRSHGAHGYKSGQALESTYRLPESCETLAEIASQAGLATAAVVANYLYLDRRFGTDQGFGLFWSAPPHSGFRFPPAERLLAQLDPFRNAVLEGLYVRDTFVTDYAIDALKEMRGRPFFLFVNYLDVHRPNERPPTAAVPLEDETAVPGLAPELLKILRGKELPEKTRRGLVNAYDRELQHLDEEVARLLRCLEEPDLARDTLVIVTSDHGEFFGEHGLIDHAVALYNEVVDVPLIVKGPGVAPGRSRKPVQVVDVFPTALEALGIPVPAGCQGASLLSSQEHPIVSEWYASVIGLLRHRPYHGRFENDLRSIRTGSWRLIEDEKGRAELYDLASDPRETRDLAAQHPERVAKMQASLAEWVSTHPEGERIPLATAPTREREQALRVLGYAGEAGAGAEATGGGKR